MSLLEVKNLKIEIKLKKSLITIVRNISFTLEKGDTLGVVGESGCGKSIINKALMGLLPNNAIVTADKLNFDGINLLELDENSWCKVRGKRISIIFQDPMSALNPCYRVGDQIAEVLKINEKKEGDILDKKERTEKIKKLLLDVGIAGADEKMNAYPHELSGGIAQRVMIVMAIASNPDVLIADEPTTALDVTIQKQVLDLLGRLQKKYNFSILFISHDFSVIQNITRKIQVMYAGEIIEAGLTSEVIKSPTHPYTRGLIDSIPSFEVTKNDELFSISGVVPNLSRRPKGCQFYDRCLYAEEKCKNILPKLENLFGSNVRCHFPLISQGAKS